MTPLSYIHRFEPATQPGSPPLLLLHGTGGNENNLVQVGRQLSPGSALLSPRGDVDEGGMPRFFRRFAEGVFDLEDVARRANALADFVRAAAHRYGFAPHALTALGYSNGANIAASMLLLRPESLAGSVLLRPMIVLQPPALPDLRGKRVTLISGHEDPIVPEDQPVLLADLFRTAGAEVALHWVDTGHQLGAADFRLAAEALATAARA